MRSKRSSKFLVISAATENYRYEYELTNVLKRAYCEKYDLSFIFEPMKIEKGLPPHYQKIDIVLKYLDSYDYVMWMDTDAWFNNFDINIIDLVKSYMGNASLMIARDYYCLAHPKEWVHSYLNTGVFIVRNNKTGKDILLKWKTPFEDAISYKSALPMKLHDQPYMCNLYLFDTEVKKNTVVLNPFILNFFPTNNHSDIIDENVGYGLNWGWYSAFIVHAAGLAKKRQKLFNGMVQYSAEQNGLKINCTTPKLECAKRVIFNKIGSKILVLTAATENYSHEYNQTIPINQKYCEQHNCDFAFYLLRCKKTDAYYGRLELIRRNMNDYDYIVWMDTDAWFNDFSVNLGDIIKENEDNKSLLVERGYTTIDKPQQWVDTYINSGVFIIKCDSNGKEILRRWIENVQDGDTHLFTETVSGLKDQPALCNMLLFDIFVRTHSNILDSLKLSSFLVERNVNWGRLNSVTFNNDWKNAFIIHAAGVVTKEPIKHMFFTALNFTKNKIGLPLTTSDIMQCQRCVCAIDDKRIITKPRRLKESPPPISPPKPIETIETQPRIPVRSGYYTHLNTKKALENYDFSKVH